MTGPSSSDLRGFHRARVELHVWAGSRASAEFCTARDAINALEAAPAASSAALSGSSPKAPGFAGGYLLMGHIHHIEITAILIADSA